MMKPYSVTVSSAILDAMGIARDRKSAVVESDMLLLAFARHVDGEAGNVLFHFGATPDVAEAVSSKNWNPSQKSATSDDVKLSRLCRHILRRASRKASWRREMEITSGRILHVFLRRRSGGDFRILTSQKVRRRRARKAIRHEVKVRRLLRIRHEGGHANVLAKDPNYRFSLFVYPPRRWASLRGWRQRRRRRRSPSASLVTSPGVVTSLLPANMEAAFENDVQTSFHLDAPTSP